MGVVNVVFFWLVDCHLFLHLLVDLDNVFCKQETGGTNCISQWGRFLCRVFPNISIKCWKLVRDVRILALMALLLHPLNDDEILWEIMCVYLNIISMRMWIWNANKNHIYNLKMKVQICQNSIICHLIYIFFTFVTVPVWYKS